MKYTKLMKERIRRVNVLFKELGYELTEGDMTESTFSSGFERDSEFHGGFLNDFDS